MTVKELIADLNKIPGNYEVQIYLSEVPGPDTTEFELAACFQHIVAMSVFVGCTIPNHERKLAYVLGAGLLAPPSPPPQPAKWER
jgi:hypothetical protein